MTIIHGIDALRFISGDFVEFDVETHYRKGVKPFKSYLITGKQIGSTLSGITCLPVSGMEVERYYISGEDITIEARLAEQTDRACVSIYTKGKLEKICAFGSFICWI